MNNKANMFLLGPIVLMVVLMAINFLVVGSAPIGDDTIDDDVSIENTGDDWWSGIPIIGGALDIATGVFNVIADFFTAVAAFFAMDFEIINSLGVYAWFVKVPCWVMLIIGIIKILPFT